MPRALSALAMARNEVAPLAFICSMTGSTLAAKRSAFALLEAMPRRCACFSFGPPSFTPLALAAASRLGARADGFALMLGHGGENMNGELIGERHVGGNELNAAFHEPGRQKLRFGRADRA